MGTGYLNDQRLRYTYANPNADAKPRDNTVADTYCYSYSHGPAISYAYAFKSRFADTISSATNANTYTSFAHPNSYGYCNSCSHANSDPGGTGR